MTITYVCAVRDQAIEAYNPPFTVPHTGAAVRGFTDEARSVKGDNAIASHPGDYELWLLGTFDTETGRIDQERMGRLIRGSDCVESK